MLKDNGPSKISLSSFTALLETACKDSAVPPNEPSLLGKVIK